MFREPKIIKISSAEKKDTVNGTVKEGEVNGATTKALTEAEKLELRAKKYGAQKDDSKLSLRAQRFGGAVQDKTTNPEIISKRAERFGIVTPEAKPNAKAAATIDPETLKKRAERFGNTKTEEPVEDDALNKRKERFGVGEEDVNSNLKLIPFFIL
jgi:hypothetical protein